MVIYRPGIGTLQGSANLVPNSVTLTAAASITAPALVNIASNFTFSPASAAAGLAANGFVSKDVLAGESATVFLTGIMEGLAGLTGQQVFLSDTSPGGITETPPSIGSGDFVQQVGIGLSATAMFFLPGQMDGPL
jgi:hypothetical protein